MIECVHAKKPKEFDHIRKLFQARLDTVAEGHQYSIQYMEPFFEKAEAGGSHHFFVSYEDGEPAAFLQVRKRKPDSMKLVFAFTHPRFRNKGHSKKLLEKALDTLKPGHVSYDISPAATFDLSDSTEKILEEYHGNK